MNRRRRVILYGGSVILGTVCASPARYPGLEIVAILPPLPDDAALEALAPDVILFDVAYGRPDAAFTLLKNCPDLLLVGINPENEQVRLWSSRQEDVVTADALLHIITRSSSPQLADSL